ncbi:MAG: L-threonylcarbamoyladenylate synthase [Flavobacteriales bacterium]|jgi:tRNA threonylcarbamoyl adenosine modification protein (Sua5/YciO/YrdC/YwlC family)|nr:L-threonylcarbamoyladenylate synthase [Flavobacteriales bacterium]
MLIQIHPDNPDPRQIKKVVECLKDGGLIIYPTDTVYGFGCDVNNKKAMEKLCRLKGVNIKKHNLAFVCYDLSHIADFTKHLETSTYKLMKKALPGPFTFILNANSSIPKLFKNKKKEIGIRIPNNNIPREIVKELGNPIVTTSVKNDDMILEYSTDPELIHEYFQNKVDMVISGGYGDSTPSTIVKCTDGYPEIIRKGKGDTSLFD